MTLNRIFVALAVCIISIVAWTYYEQSTYMVAAVRTTLEELSGASDQERAGYEVVLDCTHKHTVVIADRVPSMIIDRSGRDDCVAHAATLEKDLVLAGVRLDQRILAKFNSLQKPHLTRFFGLH